MFNADFRAYESAIRILLTILTVDVTCVSETLLESAR